MASRLQSAKYIYSQYLSSFASTPVTFSSEPREPSARKIIQQFRRNMESCSPNLFDEISLIVFETLEKHYDGTFLDPDDVVWSGPSGKSRNANFVNSAFGQMLVKDQGTSFLIVTYIIAERIVLTYQQYQRIAERVLALEAQLALHHRQQISKIMETYHLDLILKMRDLKTVSFC